MSSHFNIADLNFDLKSAAVGAHWADGSINWSVTIYADPRLYCGEEWSPVVFSERLSYLDGKACNQWQDLFPCVLEWESSYNDSIEHEEALLHVFESCGISRSRLEFGTPQLSEIPTSWAGVSDVHFDDQYSTNLPISINAQCKFLGIEVGKLGEVITMDEALARVRPIFRSQDFELKLPLDRHDPPMLIPIW